MTIEEIEDLAFRGDSLPEDIRSQADILAYLSFRSLYDFAKRVQMAPEQGRREKAQIVRAHQTNKFLEELQEDTNKMWIRIELAASEYRKAPSVEKADALLKAIYRTERKAAS